MNFFYHNDNINLSKTELLEKRIKDLEESKIIPISIISSKEIDKLWDNSEAKKFALPSCCSIYEFYIDENGKIRRI